MISSSFEEQFERRIKIVAEEASGEVVTSDLLGPMFRAGLDKCASILSDPRVIIPTNGNGLPTTLHEEYIVDAVFAPKESRNFFDNSLHTIVINNPFPFDGTVPVA